MDEPMFIDLELEDGLTIKCEIIGVFNYKDNEYIAMMPQDDTEDIYLYGYNEQEDGGFELLDIEDDDLFEEVAAEFDLIMDAME